MADKELDKMKLATMLNSTPSSGGLNATNTRTPSFVDPSSRLSLALDEWRRSNAPAAYLLRGDPQGLINELTTPKPVPTTEQSLQDMYNFAVGSIAPIEGGAESSFSSKLNLKPRISADKLKGPDLQPARNFINQSKSLPGVTKEGHDFGTKVAKLIDPDTVMSKQDFVKDLRPNQYRKIDMESTAANAYAHYRQEAEDNFGSYLSDAHLEHAGVPDEHSPHIFETLTNRQHSLDNDPEIIQQNKELFNEMPKSTREYLKKEGVSNVDELDSWYDHLVHENIDDYIQYAYSTGEMDYDINAGGYRYKGIQRLVPKELTGNKYFEIGVTHPNQEGIPYKHYDAPEDPNGLIGHVRGSIITEPTPVTTGSRSKFWAKPGDTIIEEVQADAQKTADQVDHLHQVHGTVTKAGIQHALENGSRTVYVPTSRAIGAGERGSPGGEFASIYDSQVMNEAVNPLKDMEGVKYTPPTQTPYSYPWTGLQHEDAYNVLGIPKSQHAPADLYTIRDDRPWHQEQQYANMNPRQEILNNIDKHQKALEREKRLQENVTPVATSAFTPADYNKRIVDIQKSLDANQNYLKWMDEKFPGDVNTQKSTFNDAIKQVLDKRNTEIQNIQQSTNEMPYHKLEFTDEAANNIINGEGQSLPGYKKGGSVKKIDTKSKNSDIMHQSLAQMRAEILRRNYGN